VVGVCAAYGRRRVLHDVDWVVRPGVTGLLARTGRVRRRCCLSWLVFCDQHTGR
jgi:hypothetical protein